VEGEEAMVHSQGLTGWGFLVIWEFTVRGGQERAFGKAYGPEGEWVKLFCKDSAYLGTELVRDVENGKKYLTLDYWNSEEAYEEFRRRHAAEYKTIDAACEAMTESEREIGRYATVSGSA
jgi:heme-degrading monooxygenase HmoA